MSLFDHCIHISNLLLVCAVEIVPLHTLMVLPHKAFSLLVQFCLLSRLLLQVMQQLLQPPLLLYDQVICRLVGLLNKELQLALPLCIHKLKACLYLLPDRLSHSQLRLNLLHLRLRLVLLSLVIVALKASQILQSVFTIAPQLFLISNKTIKNKLLTS